MYRAGKSSSHIGRVFNVSDVAVLKTLKKKGISSRTPSLARRILPLNETVFDNLNKRALYWIGFLMADGNITNTKEQKSIAIYLAEKDRGHIVKFLEFIGGYGRKITHVKKTHAHGVKIRSKHMVDKLMSVGVKPRKSLSAKALKGTQKSRDFWRGVIDGDGSIGIYKNSPSISLCGSLNLTRQFRKFSLDVLENNHEIRVMKIKGINLWRVNLFGYATYNIIKTLYAGNNGNVLTRKDIIAKKILNEFKNKHWKNYTGKRKGVKTWVNTT